MSYWSNRIAADAFMVKDENTVIAHCVSQAIASKIVNALNHSCIPSACEFCGPPEMAGTPWHRASVCAGRYTATLAKLKDAELALLGLQAVTGASSVGADITDEHLRKMRERR